LRWRGPNGSGLTALGLTDLAERARALASDRR
jgi:hypothetical protein